MVTIRPAAPEDAGGIAAIYTPIVQDTPISFEVEPPDAREMRRRIVDTSAGFPWLVCERDEMILGYAYAGRHRARAAYQWSVDSSVYVRADARRLGVGRALYTSLFALLELQGFYKVYAGITLPNPASVGLHESLGFRPVGTYRAVGFKLGAWHDVGWWELTLRAASGPPDPPLDVGVLRRSPGWETALAAGSGLLRR